MTTYNRTETFSICEPYLNSNDAGYSRFKNTYVIASCQGLDGWISTFWELTCCIPTSKIQEQFHLGRKPYHNNHTHNKNVPTSSAGTSHAVKCCFVAIFLFFPKEQVTVTVPYPSHAAAFVCLKKIPCHNHLQNPCLFSTFKLESTSPIITLGGVVKEQWWIHVILKSLHHHWCWDGWKGYYCTFLFHADLQARRISQTKIINIVNYPILSLLRISLKTLMAWPGLLQANIWSKIIS